MGHAARVAAAPSGPMARSGEGIDLGSGFAHVRWLQAATTFSKHHIADNRRDVWSRSRLSIGLQQPSTMRHTAVQRRPTPALLHNTNLMQTISTQPAGVSEVSCDQQLSRPVGVFI